MSSQYFEENFFSSKFFLLQYCVQKCLVCLPQNSTPLMLTTFIDGHQQKMEIEKC